MLAHFTKVMEGSARKMHAAFKAVSCVTPVKARPRHLMNDFFAYADADMVEQLVDVDGAKEDGELN